MIHYQKKKYSAWSHQHLFYLTCARSVNTALKIIIVGTLLLTPLEWAWCRYYAFCWSVDVTIFCEWTGKLCKKQKMLVIINTQLNVHGKQFSLPVALLWHLLSLRMDVWYHISYVRIMLLVYTITFHKSQFYKMYFGDGFFRMIHWWQLNY